MIPIAILIQIEKLIVKLIGIIIKMIPLNYLALTLKALKTIMAFYERYTYTVIQSKRCKQRIGIHTYIVLKTNTISVTSQKSDLLRTVR